MAVKYCKNIFLAMHKFIYRCVKKMSLNIVEYLIGIKHHYNDEISLIVEYTCIYFYKRSRCFCQDDKGTTRYLDPMPRASPYEF
jgi:hypothetical protein